MRAHVTQARNSRVARSRAYLSRLTVALLPLSVQPSILGVDAMINKQSKRDIDFTNVFSTQLNYSE